MGVSQLHGFYRFRAGAKKPRTPLAGAEVTLQFPAAHYELTASFAFDGGNVDLVRSMGFEAVRRRRTKRTAFRAKNAARDTLNGLIAAITHGDDNARVDQDFTPSQRYGHSGGQLWVEFDADRDGAWPEAGERFNVNSADEAVDRGVIYAIPATRIVGGELFLKRALYNMTRHPGQVTSCGRIVMEMAA